KAPNPIVGIELDAPHDFKVRDWLTGLRLRRTRRPAWRPGCLTGRFFFRLLILLCLRLARCDFRVSFLELFCDQFLIGRTGLVLAGEILGLGLTLRADAPPGHRMATAIKLDVP